MATTTLHTPDRPRRIPAIAGRVAAISRRIAAAVSRDAINRRVLRQLSAMSERDLKDIGLVRQDVVDASSLYADRDASLFLVGRRDERRASRRAR